MKTKIFLNVFYKGLSNAFTVLILVFGLRNMSTWSQLKFPTGQGNPLLTFVLWRFNPLNVNPLKWSCILKQLVDNNRRIVWGCLTILWGWHFKSPPEDLMLFLVLTLESLVSHLVDTVPLLRVKLRAVL